MSHAHYLKNVRIDRSQAEPFEAGVVQWIVRPGEGESEAFSSGFWFVDQEAVPEPTVVTGHAHEVVYIVEGHIRVQLEGEEPVDLTAGSTSFFPKGVPVTWTVLAPTVEFFVYC